MVIDDLREHNTYTKDTLFKGGDVKHSDWTLRNVLAHLELGWKDLSWPADSFAVTSFCLERTGAYVHAVSPPAGRRWPPSTKWACDVLDMAVEWRKGGGTVPKGLSRRLNGLRRYQDTPLTTLLRMPTAFDQLLTLHSAADEVFDSVLEHQRPEGIQEKALQEKAEKLLTTTASLSHAATHVVRVLPKQQMPPAGLTLASFSRNLAFLESSIAPEWHALDHVPFLKGSQLNLLLLPWPLAYPGVPFVDVASESLDFSNESYGMFGLASEPLCDMGVLLATIQAAQVRARVDCVVLPELALPESALTPLEALLLSVGVSLYVVGAAGKVDAAGLRTSFVQYGLHDGTEWGRSRQFKHHRWSLDRAQILQYQLGFSLRANRVYWEAITVEDRRLLFILLNQGCLLAPLICEDLARQEPMGRVVRAVGPSLVVALLLDGPQIPVRWPARYAAILADDPGSSVLTLTALALSSLTEGPNRRDGHAVAMWRERGAPARSLYLEEKARGILLTLNLEEWQAAPADGRPPVTRRTLPRYAGHLSVFA